LTPPKSSSWTKTHQSAIFPGQNLRSVHDPIDYTRGTPDPKHNSQTMRSPMHIEVKGFNVRTLESTSLSEKSFRKSDRHLLLPKIKFSTLASTTRLKEKGVYSANAKSDSLYKVKPFETQRH